MFIFECNIPPVPYRWDHLCNKNDNELNYLYFIFTIIISVIRNHYTVVIRWFDNCVEKLTGLSKLQI